MNYDTQMTLQSSVASLEEVDPSNTPSTSTSEVAFPLGFNDQLTVKPDGYEELDVLALASEHPGGKFILGSPNSKIGSDVNVHIEGNAQFIVNNHSNSLGLPFENGQCKEGQVTSSEGIPPRQVPKSLKQLLKDRPTQLWLAGMILAVMSISSLVLYFCFFNYATPTAIPPTFGHNDNLGDGIQIISRKEWLAREPLNVTKITETPKMVRILHSKSPNCYDYQTCANKIQALRDHHVDDGLPDIAYNFMVGGDGNVYIGRGEEVANDARPEAIDIAYIGNFLAPYDKMTPKMNEAGQKLIQRLVERGKITEDYIVVAQNQTENDISPGENVYKYIIHWPHYDSGLYFKQ